VSHSYSQGYYSVPAAEYEELHKMLAAAEYVIRKQTLRAERAEIENAVLDKANEDLMDKVQELSAIINMHEGSTNE